MKCPKCHYLSFDPEPRCRNCGFSLNLEATDLPISDGRAPDAPLADLELRSIETAAPADPVPAFTAVPPPAPSQSRGTAGNGTPSPRPVRRIAVPRLDRPRTRLDPEERGTADLEATPAPRPTAVSSPVPPPATSELPLFVKGMGDNSTAEAEPFLEAKRETAISPFDPVQLSTPNPVAEPTREDVLRAAPVEPAVASPAPVPIVSTAQWAADSTTRPSAVSGRRKIGPLDRDLLNDLDRIEKTEQKKMREAAAKAGRLPDAAGPGRRLVAAIVDGVVLSGILIGLFALTLRWTSLDWANVSVLPIWPTVAFLTLVAAGYLLLFTAAAGQTPGKMMAGIRVVGAGTNGDGSLPLSAGQACLRELVAVPAVLGLGIGFFPALLGDERGIHDRIASTRVVRG